jgi:hypothetical protein
MEAILTSSHDNGSDTTNAQDKWWDNWKSWEWNETNEDSYLGTWHLPKFQSLHDLSIRVNPKVTEEVAHHAGLWVDRCLHLCLHVCKLIHSSLESSDPFYRVLSLVDPITDVPLQRSVPGRGGGFGSEARLKVPLRGVTTTTIMVTRGATPIPRVPVWSWGWACGVVMVYFAASMQARPRVWCGPVKLWRASPIQWNYSVRLSQEYSRRPDFGNQIALRPYNIDKEWSGS